MDNTILHDLLKYKLYGKVLNLDKKKTRKAKKVIRNWKYKASMGNHTWIDLNTGLITYTRPDGVSPWLPAFDSKSNSDYFFNMDTDETTWDLPKDYDERIYTEEMSTDEEKDQEEKYPNPFSQS